MASEVAGVIEQGRVRVGSKGGLGLQRVMSFQGA